MKRIASLFMVILMLNNIVLCFGKEVKNETTDSYKICLNCDTENSIDSVYCSNCGSTSLRTIVLNKRSSYDCPIECKNCGATNVVGAKHCQKCGVFLDDNNTKRQINCNEYKQWKKKVQWCYTKEVIYSVVIGFPAIIISLSENSENIDDSVLYIYIGVLIPSLILFSSNLQDKKMLNEIGRKYNWTVSIKKAKVLMLAYNIYW